MRICTRCVLPETFPRIRFDAAGVCNYCLEYGVGVDLAAERDRSRRKFEEIVARVRGKKGYQCLLAYSGGKDSSYTLWLLREQYGLNMLAVTFDNGFVSPKAYENIRRVVEALNIDHLFVKPRFDVLRKIFVTVAATNPYPPKALQRASSICNACIGLIKSVTLRIAIERRIPIVAYGFSPGQADARASVVRLNDTMVRQMHSARSEPLLRIAGDEIAPFLLKERHFNACGDGLFNVNPLAFHECNERQIVEQVRKLDWEKPTDTDGNSTNCLLNAYANRDHIARHGFHPYAYELSGLVRSGAMEREEALDKLSNLASEKANASVADRLQTGAIHRESTPERFFGYGRGIDP